MFVKKLDDSEMHVKRWHRTLTDAFGPEAKLHVEPQKPSLRTTIVAYAVFALIGAGWYLIVGLKAGG